MLLSAPFGVLLDMKEKMCLSQPECVLLLLLLLAQEDSVVWSFLLQLQPVLC